MPLQGRIGRQSGVSSDVEPRIRRAEQLLRAGLDTLEFGFALFDRHLRLVASNKAFRTLRGYPAALVKPGAELVDLFRHNARRGDYGDGDVEAIAMARLELMRSPFSREHTTPDGRVLFVQATPIVHEGLVLAYTDITARKEAERLAAQRDKELHVALDNMAGALAYTDADGTIVLRNNRFADMYPVPKELWTRDARIRRSFATSPSTGTTGQATSTRSWRVASKTCAIRAARRSRTVTPDGRVYRIVRRRAEGGGTVTVITDVTDFKRAEETLARKEAVLHAALDNMPGALVYTDADLDIVICNPRSASGIRSRRNCASRASPIRRSFVISRKTAITETAMSRPTSRDASRACAIPPASRSRIVRPTGACTASRGGGRRTAAPSR